MERLRSFTWAGYLIAIALMAIPATDFVLRVQPLTPTSVRWRFGALGVLSGSLMSPFMGLFLAVLIAASAGQRVVLRLLGWMTWLGTLVLLGLATLFVFDALQTRASASETARTTFDTAAIMGVVKFLVFVIIGLAIGLGTRRGVRALRPPKRSEARVGIVSTFGSTEGRTAEAAEGSTGG